MRYLLFGGDQYYAEGGFLDLIDNNDNLQILLNKVVPNKNEISECEWWHIWDNQTNKIIGGSLNQAHGTADLDENLCLFIYDYSIEPAKQWDKANRQWSLINQENDRP